MENELSFNIDANTKITFTNHENKLLFIHTDWLSSQWGLNDIGVEIGKHGDSSFLKIYGKDFNYQNWTLPVDCYDKCYKFFKAIGFPLTEKEAVH